MSKLDGEQARSHRQGIWVIREVDGQVRVYCISGSRGRMLVRVRGDRRG
jgi:hypothetical protein